MTYQSGRLVNVDLVRFGDELTAAAALGATSLIVDDVSDFDEDGGKLTLNGAVYTYLDADDETGTLTLATGITAAADEGDSVEVYDEIYGVVATEKQAEVQFDVDDGNDDSVLASIAAHLVPLIPEGVRGNAGEHVLLELDGDEWRIIDVLGLADSMNVKFHDQDTYTVTAADIVAGSITAPLTYQPEEGSVHLRWGVLPQPPSEYDVDYVGRAVSMSLGSFVDVGDEVWFMYAYRDQPRHADAVILPFGSTGWAKLGIAAGDTTVRASIGYDTSAWAVAGAPFGDVIGSNFYAGLGYDWLPPVTAMTLMTALWARHDLDDIPSGLDLTVRVRGDNLVTVYWNGTSLGNVDAVAETPFTVPAGSILAHNVLAVRVQDSGPAGPGNHVYLDVQVERGA